MAAGIHTSILVAGLRVPALVGCSALARGAAGKRVPDVPMRTRTHGAIIARLVVAGCAGGSGAARVGLAQVRSSELAAAIEGVAGVSLGAAADGLVVVDAAESVGATGGPGLELSTRVLAAVLDAGEAEGTVAMLYAFWPTRASTIRIPNVVLGTRTPADTIGDLAYGARSTRFRCA